MAGRYMVFVLALLCVSCGSGGDGGRQEQTTSAATSESDPSRPGNGSFPPIDAPPANNAAMRSCESEAAVPDEATLTGVVQYQRVPIDNDGLDYSAIRQLPARGIVVQAVDAPLGTCSSDVVATALTNGRGEFGLNVPVDRQVCVEARAQLYRDSSAGGPGWDIQVVDNTNDRAAYYLIDSTAASPRAQPVRNLLAEAGVTPGARTYSGPRAAAPFAILDSLCEATQTVLAVEPETALPLLRVNWSENNIAVAGDSAEGDIGGAYFSETRYMDGDGNQVGADRDIYLLGDAGSNTDEYDPHVINHEYSHYLTSVFSRFDGTGGEHYLGDRLDPRLALEEGLADAFAAISLDRNTAVIADSRIYRDSLGTEQQRTFRFPIDRNVSNSYGWYSESSAHSLLYNAFDADNSGFDTLSLGFAPLFATLRDERYRNSESLLTLFTFFHTLKQRTGQAVAVDTLLAQESIEPVNDPYGSDESVMNNDAALALSYHEKGDVEPVYLPLQEGVTKKVCSNNQFGAINKLANGRYLRFDPGGGIPFQLQAVPVTNGRPVIEIYRRGRLLTSAEASRRGESASVSVEGKGEVIAIIYDYDNFRDDAASPLPGRYCFDVSVDAT